MHLLKHQKGKNRCCQHCGKPLCLQCQGCYNEDCHSATVLYCLCVLVRPCEKSVIPHGIAISQQITLHNVQQLATQLKITFSGGNEQEEWFDLDTGTDALFGLNGTYRKSTEGIIGAYGDLVRYQERITQWQAQQQQ